MKQSRVSRDGTRLSFTSKSGAGFTGYDHTESCPDLSYTIDVPCREVYLYEASANGGAGELRCLSCRPDGAPATADATVHAKFGNGVVGQESHLPRVMSEDGRRVFFTSGERLVPEDQNGLVQDAYMYDSESGELHLISSGKSSANSYFLDAGANGEDVFFVTREQLSGWDVDNAYDLYDARVGGGLPEPSPPPPSCQGDGCQPAPGTLSDPTPGSATFLGPGDPRPAINRRCPKGKRKVKARGKTRCVKWSRAKRRANNDRRASR